VTRFFDWLKAWVKDVVSTNLTIVTGLCLAILYVVWALAAATFGHSIDANTLDTVGLFISALITGGVVQFTMKRRTDKDYIAAKAGATAPTRDQS
jgi:hypothetical protein